MLQKSDIELFYRDLAELDIVKKNAEIVRRTGESKGNVSAYLNKKKIPGENFIRKFYDSFKVELEGIKKQKVDQQQESREDKIINELFKQLEWMRNRIDTNLDYVLEGVLAVSARQSVDREVVYQSLSRLEKKDQGALLREANRRMHGDEEETSELDNSK